MLTPDQVTALAPDASSFKAGRDLAVARKWQTLGRDAHEKREQKASETESAPKKARDEDAAR